MSHRYPTGLPSPAPELRDPQTSAYWEAAERGELVLPYCLDCQAFYWYPRGFCPRCGGARIDWRQSAGRGHIYSHTIVRRAGGIWAAHAPFVLAYVVLDEGVTVQANIVDCTEEQLVVDARVEARFERQGSDEAPALRFVPRT